MISGDQRTAGASGTGDGSGSGLGDAGWAVLPGFLSADDVRVLKHEVDRLVEQPVVPGCERPNNRLIPLRWSDRVVDRILRDRGRVAAVAEATMADDLRWISGYVSVRDPYSSALWWHQDWWCWDHPVSFRRAAPQVALLCYLTDTSERNAALRLLPGSHHQSRSLHARLADAHGESAPLAAGHDVFATQPDQVTLALGAGDAVVIDYRLLHGTHGNESPARRDCVLLSFTPSWGSLPPDMRGHLIQHLALPGADERWERTSWRARLLPHFAGRRRDLSLNRTAPPTFAIGG